MDSVQRDIPPGLADLLEGFVLVVLKEKPENLMDFAAQYFNSIRNRRKSLADHGVDVETMAVDFFFTGTEWNGVV
jgi:hypothetical protein